MNNPTDIKQQFPIFSAHPSLVYLDNAATTQRPETVIKRLDEFNRQENATIRRGVYQLSAQATRTFDAARTEVADFFGAPDASCITFTQGTTESINIVARSVIGPILKPGANVVVSLMEHHANFIPWQMLCQEKGAELRVVPVDGRGELEMKDISKLIDPQTACVAITHISNTLGTINPIEEIIALAHQQEVPVLIDAAQSAALYPTNLEELNCDFWVCSGHKMFGPFGVGVLYVHPRHHNKVQPYNYGGGIIRSVTVERTDFLPYPFNLEAGTPNVAGVVGLAEAIRFLKTLDRPAILQHLNELTIYGKEQLSAIDGLTLLGNPAHFSSVFSFSIEGMHPHDIATFLNEEQIAVRAGQHCTQPLLDHFETPATVRASLSAYNTREDVERLVEALKEIKAFWV
uniref:Probable cysteine desulfurase n=1 Tax=Roseihalotalea indica TaxID=2867963 RepID=A0AA49GKW9_9BACT|nr:cysteine desulfurase [Tunicatimonas sp. TK19036]